jgi:sporulation protein YlmC with PRC-barrel domain
MRAERLKGLAVVDLDAAEKIGTISDVLLDPAARRVAGLIVARGQSLLGGQEFTLPASAVHALGHDAVTVRRPGADDAIAHLAGLPRLAQVVGRKVVTESGRLVGTIGDVEIDPRDGRILGYPIEGRAAGGLAGLFGAGDPSDAARGAYILADADLRVGRELVVVPDEALAPAEPRGDAAPGVKDAPAVDRLARQPLPDRSDPSDRPAPPPAAGTRWIDPLPRAGAPSWVEPVAPDPAAPPDESLEPTQVIAVAPRPPDQQRSP